MAPSRGRKRSTRGSRRVAPRRPPCLPEGVARRSLGPPPLPPGKGKAGLRPQPVARLSTSLSSPPKPNRRTLGAPASPACGVTRSTYREAFHLLPRQAATRPRCRRETPSTCPCTHPERQGRRARRRKCEPMSRLAALITRALVRAPPVSVGLMPALLLHMRRGREPDAPPQLPTPTSYSNFLLQPPASNLLLEFLLKLPTPTSCFQLPTRNSYSSFLLQPPTSYSNFPLQPPTPTSHSNLLLQLP